MKTPTIYIECFRGERLSRSRQVKPAYFFRIRGANQEIIAQSEAYNSAQSRNKTVALIMDAKIELT